MMIRYYQSTKTNFLQKNANFIKKLRIFIIFLLFFLFFLLILSINSTFCAGENTSSISEIYNLIDSSLQDFDFSSLQEIADNQTLFDIGDVIEKIKSITLGGGAVDFKNLIDAIGSIVVSIILQFLPTFSLIIGITLVCSLISNIRSKFHEKSVSQIVNFVCFSAVAILVISTFGQIVLKIKTTLYALNSTLNVIFPILLTCMVALGGNTTVATFQPTLAILANVMSNLMNYLLLPICTLCFLFSIIGNLSDSVKLDKYTEFFHSLFKWLIGIIFTVFFAILSIQGINTSSIDSISLKATKFTISSYLPYVGGYISQGLDMLMLSSVLIKNSVGLVGILLILSLLIEPILSIAIFSLSLKLASAVLEPIGNTKISGLLSSIAKSISMLSAVLIVSGFAYTLSVGMLMVTLNL